MMEDEALLKETDQVEIFNEDENDNYDLTEDEHPSHMLDEAQKENNDDLCVEGDNSSTDEKAALTELLENLPEEFPAAQPAIKEEIAPLLLSLDGGLLEYYIEKLMKKTKVSKKVITEELEGVKGELAKKDLQLKQEQSIDPEIQLQADKIAQDPHLLKTKISLIRQLGVVGEDKNIGTYFLALDSRLLPNRGGSSEVLAVKNAGMSGAGKSYPLSKCLEIYPKSAYHLILGGSPKSLYFVEGGLKNKCLVIAEGFSFQNGNSNDTEFALVVRSILSEGEASYEYLSYDDEGNRVTKIQTLGGPTSLITTSIYGKLEPQFENRLLTVHPDISVNQTKQIIAITAEQSAGLEEIITDDVIEVWKVFHGMLQPYEVIVPFASKISEYVTRCDGLPLSLRRSFKRVISSIKTITVIHQFQREKDEKGRLIAQMEDYFMAYQVVNESFRESLGEDGKNADRMELIRKNEPISSSILSNLFGVSGPAVSQWVKENVEKENLVWCDENGDLFPDEATLEREKRKGKALLKIAHMRGLPTPYQVSNQPEWDVGGELYSKFDLGFGDNFKHKTTLPNTQLHDEIITVKDEKTHDDNGFDGEKEKPVKELSQNKPDTVLDLVRELDKMRI